MTKQASALLLFIKNIAAYYLNLLKIFTGILSFNLNSVANAME